MNQIDSDFALTEDTSMVKRKRPVFLLVLCILTFVASGFGIVSGVFGLFGAGDIEAQFKAAANDPVSREIFSTLDYAAMKEIQDWANILGLISSILCLGGALIMFKMLKIGFLPYVIGQAVAVYGSYIGLSVLKEMSDAMPTSASNGILELTGVISMIVIVIFAIAFIIMYAVNLKHLK